MKKIFCVFIALLLIIISVLTGCEKDSYYKENMLGCWKLNELTIVYTTIIDGSHQDFVIDYSENNIIYEFQENNKLVVHNSVSGTSQKKVYSYKSGKRPDAFCFTQPPIELQIKIDKEKYNCIISPEDETMGIFIESINPQKIIDETDFVILEQNNLYYSYKTFVKLK